MVFNAHEMIAINIIITRAYFPKVVIITCKYDGRRDLPGIKAK